MLEIYILINKLHTHPVGIDPTTLPSIPLLREKGAKCQLSYSSLVDLRYSNLQS